MRVFIEHIKLYDHAEAWPKKKSNLPSIAKKNFLKGVFSHFKGLNERFKRSIFSLDLNTTLDTFLYVKKTFKN